jgi:two-component system, chemotaxis family, chemotaxis protein CheY
LEELISRHVQKWSMFLLQEGENCMSVDHASSGNTEARLIVVDDSPTARKLVGRLLSELGFQKWTEAPDGERALSLIRLHPVDLVISDWNMPKLDGLGLVKEIRSDEQLKKTPVLLLTSANERDKIVAAIQAGISDYIAKPFNLETLQQKLKRFVRIPKPS